jgi:hypothetical protein
MMTIAKEQGRMYSDGNGFAMESPFHKRTRRRKVQQIFNVFKKEEFKCSKLTGMQVAEAANGPDISISEKLHMSLLKQESGWDLGTASRESMNSPAFLLEERNEPKIHV